MTRFAMLVTLLCAFLIASRSDSQEADAIFKPLHDLPIPTTIRNQLSDVADVEALLNLPNKDEALEYDTVRDTPDTLDFMDNDPHVALVRGGRVIFNVSAGSLAKTGPIRFHGMALLPNERATPFVVCAFTLGVDSSATFFVFLGEQSGGYGVIATLEGRQAQVRIRNGSRASFEFWRADGFSGRGLEGECVWCPQYYKKTEYRFREGRLERLGSVRTKRGYDPGLFFEAPFTIVK